MKILLVDDQGDDRRLLRYIVERHGHETIEASDGQEGLEKAKTGSPGLIISDALMPVMDGFRFLNAIKQDGRLKSIPFIFYSATYKGAQDVELALSLGAEAYIFKPKDPVTVAMVVRPLQPYPGYQPFGYAGGIGHHGRKHLCHPT